MRTGSGEGGRARLYGFGWLISLLSALVPVGMEAQSVEELASACAADRSHLESWCAETALGLQALQGAAVLAAAGGSPVAGASSTLGRRLGAMPRISGSGRVGLTRAPVPEIRQGAGPDPARSRTIHVPSMRLEGALGVVDGISVMPTVGGILSVDLLAGASLLHLREGQGFDGSVLGWGVGTRVGLLRESFTLPGISVSVVRRGVGEIRHGSVEGGEDGEVVFDASGTSLRMTVGKDLLALGLLAGTGWDRVSSSGGVRVRDFQGGTDATASFRNFTDDRWIFFGGASLSFLVLQLSAEGGWAEGYAPVPGRAAGGFDPTRSGFFGSAAVRITF